MKQQQYDRTVMHITCAVLHRRYEIPLSVQVATLALFPSYLDNLGGNIWELFLGQILFEDKGNGVGLVTYRANFGDELTTDRNELIRFWHTIARKGRGWTHEGRNM